MINVVDSLEIIPHLRTHIGIRKAEYGYFRQIHWLVDANRHTPLMPLDVDNALPGIEL